MAIVKTKGTKLQQEIASVYTDVAQVISIDLPETESQTYEADTLDAGVGIPRKSTGSVDGGECGFDLFFDPALAGHQALTDILTSPPADGTDWKVIFATATGSPEWTFTGAGFKLGGSVELGDGLKASCSIALDGIPVFPT